MTALEEELEQSQTNLATLKEERTNFQTLTRAIQVRNDPLLESWAI